MSRWLTLSCMSLFLLLVSSCEVDMDTDYPHCSLMFTYSGTAYEGGCHLKPLGARNYKGWVGVTLTRWTGEGDEVEKTVGYTSFREKDTLIVGGTMLNGPGVYLYVPWAKVKEGETLVLNPQDVKFYTSFNPLTALEVTFAEIQFEEIHIPPLPVENTYFKGRFHIEGMDGDRPVNTKKEYFDLRLTPYL